MKKLIKTSWNAHSLNEDQLTCAILQYRNTPSRKDGLSPAQKLFGQPIQDTLPAHRRAFSREWQQSNKDTEKIASESQQRVELYYNLHARTLPEIHIGSNVAIQNRDAKCWDIYGKVTHIDLHHRYYIKTSSGRVLVRNRRFIRRKAPLSIPTVHQPMQRLAASNERATNTPQHPNCQRRRPGRLIEDMKSFSLCVKWHKSLVGRCRKLN